MYKLIILSILLSFKFSYSGEKEKNIQPLDRKKLKIRSCEQDCIDALNKIDMKTNSAAREIYDLFQVCMLRCNNVKKETGNK